MNIYFRVLQISLAILGRTVMAAPELSPSPLKCGEIRVVSQVEACPEINSFIKGVFATCMDYNLAAKMWSKDQAARSQGESKLFTEYMSARKALRNQLVVSLNDFSELNKKSDCRGLVQSGGLAKAIEVMRESAQLTEVVFPELNLDGLMPKKDCADN